MEKIFFGEVSFTQAWIFFYYGGDMKFNIAEKIKRIATGKQAQCKI